MSAGSASQHIRINTTGRQTARGNFPKQISDRMPGTMSEKWPQFMPCRARLSRMRDCMSYSLPKYCDQCVYIYIYIYILACVRFFYRKPRSLSEHVTARSSHKMREDVRIYTSNRVQKKARQKCPKTCQVECQCGWVLRKVLGNGIFEVRRSKERCPEHQIAGLVRHCPREIFKQIAGVLGLVCHPAKGFLGNLCFMLLDSKDCDRLLALKC